MPLSGVLLRTRIRSRQVLRTRQVAPAQAFYSTDLHEFILPYDAVRHSEIPDRTLLEFLQIDLRGRRGPREVGSRRARVVARLRHGVRRFAH